MIIITIINILLHVCTSYPIYLFIVNVCFEMTLKVRSSEVVARISSSQGQNSAAVRGPR